MDSYAFVALLSAFLALASGLRVMIKAERLFLSKAYFLATVAAFCFCLTHFGLIKFAGSAQTMHPWVRMFVVPGLWLTPALLNLLTSVSPRRSGLQRLMLAISCACAGVSVLYWIPYVSPLSVISFRWDNALTLQSLPYLVFFVNCAVVLPAGLLIVLIQQRQAEPLLQRQRVIITAACVLSAGGAVGTVLSAMAFALYPASMLLVAFGLMLGASALLSFRSLEPELIVHKIVLTVMFIAPLLAFQALGSWLLSSWIDFIWAGALPALVVFLVVLFSPYRLWVEKQVAQLVFRGKYNYQSILAELSQSLVAVVDIDQLTDMMVNIVIQTLGVEGAVLFLEEEHERVYRVRAGSGMSAEGRESLCLHPHDQLVLRLSREREILVTAELRQQEPEALMQNLLSPLAGSPGEVIVPLLFKDRLTGVLAVGAKKPAGIFNQGDLSVLRNFAAEASIAIEHARLYSEAIVDRTTGVFNHHYFIVRLREEVARSRRYGRPISLLLVDVDEFKDFEQSYNMHRGNMLLRDLGKRFKSLLRATDVLSRYTASTFAVIVPETKAPAGAAPAEIIRKHIQDSMIVAERLRQAVGEINLFPELAPDDQPLAVSVSVGAAYFDGVSEKFSAEEFIHRAEQALHRARQEGGNRVCLREKQ